MIIDDFNKDFKQKFLTQNPNIYLWLQLGRKNSSLELHLRGCGYTFDLIFLSKTSSSGYCNNIHTESSEP